MVKRLYPAAVRFIWALLLLVMPLTSFPLASRIIGSTMVAPASGLVLAVLLVAWFLPYLWRRGSLPRQILPLLGFFAAALVGVLVAYFTPHPAFREVAQWRTNLEALLTLVMGIAFYLVASSWARSRADLEFSLRWLNWGGLVLVGWTLLQGAVWHSTHAYPDWLNAAQHWFSSSILFPDRMTGLAYEPSWLAHQLNMAYLPFWLAATARGYSAHRFRIWKITFENVLLAGGIVALLLSVSRVGMVAFLLMVALLAVFANLALLRWLENRLLTGRRGRRRLRLVMTLVLLLAYLALLAGVGYGFSRFDRRMAKIFDLTVLKTQGVVYYANQLVFAERVVFWEAGYRIFNDHPLLGVGLGNAGYYFPRALSSFSWNLTEVRRAMYEWTTLPNVKSLWVRLLSETGIIGFAFFIGWCALVWQSARFLWSQPGKMARAVGLAGGFTLVGLLAEGFSVDTFALPYVWVSLGLVTAACELARCSPGELSKM